MTDSPLTRVSRRRLLHLTSLGIAGLAAAPADAAAKPANVLTIAGTGSRATYEFGVSGRLEKSTANGANVNSSDEVTGSSASGVVGISADSYAFSGDLTEFALDGDADVFLNGDPLDPSQYLDHVLTIAGTGSRATYEFGVSGRLEKSTANGANINSNDEITGSSASGVVGISADSYAFDGGLTDFDLDGDADVLLDGEPVPIVTDNTLTIVGTGSRATYNFSVSGRLEKSTANGANINSNDEITGSSASGVVGISADSYDFAGSLETFELDGPADVTLNGDPLDTGRLDHTLTFASNGGRYTYEFSVSDVLKKSFANGATVDDTDTIDGTTATGQGGGGGVDSYGFAGDLRDLDVTGDVTVTLDGQTVAVDPSPLLGIYNGLSDANFDTVARIEEWQGAAYPVQNFFVPWDPSTGHMDWLFEEVLPQIHAAGRIPLLTWEPFTPGTVPSRPSKSSKTVARRSVAETRTATDARKIVERGNYDAYLETLASATPEDVEARIAAGEYDPYIDEWADRLREWLAGPDGVLGTDDDRRAYLRLGHEMNGDWYPWAPTVGDSSASSYVDMWRHVHDRFAAAGIESLEWMWCVNAEDVGAYTAEDLYPGDSYVDWVAVDGYQWGASREWSNWADPETVFGEMLGRLRTMTDKPISVPETASSSKTASGYDPERKGEWIRAAFAYFDEEGIDMWCWFNEDKETDWAMFDGARGTETVVDDGESVDAYTAYREGVDSYDTEITSSRPMTTAAFTGER